MHIRVDGNALYSVVAGAGAVVRLVAESIAATMNGQVKMKTMLDLAVQRAQSTPNKHVVWCIPAQCASQSEHIQPGRAQSMNQTTVNQSDHSLSMIRKQMQSSVAA